MNRNCRLFSVGVLACVGMWLGGCCFGKKEGPGAVSVCKENTKAGLATIKCQPLDVELRATQAAVFKVEAEGTDLIYQWYFRSDTSNGDPVGAGTTGGTTKELKVTDIDADDVGAYWCEIDSTDSLGLPVRTRTRDAFLGLAKLPKSPTPGDPTQTFPPQHAFMPNPVTGSSMCGTHCGWISYRNTNGVGFDPDNVTPALTKGLIKVRIGSNPGTYRLSNTYRVKVVDSSIPPVSVCASDSPSAADPTNTQREFSPINPNKVYWFTVYFLSPCPTLNSDVFFELSFVP